jgi:hypothetical protein
VRAVKRLLAEAEFLKAHSVATLKAKKEAYNEYLERPQ